MFQRQNRLHQAGNARRSLRVTEIRFDRTDVYTARLAEYISDRDCLDRIAYRSPGSMALQKADQIDTSKARGDGVKQPASRVLTSTMAVSAGSIPASAYAFLMRASCATTLVANRPVL